MILADPMDWTWTDNPAAPVVTGQVPRASRYRVGYMVTDIIQPAILVLLTLGRWLCVI